MTMTAARTFTRGARDRAALRRFVGAGWRAASVRIRCVSSLSGFARDGSEEETDKERKKKRRDEDEEESSSSGRSSSRSDGGTDGGGGDGRPVLRLFDSSRQEKRVFTARKEELDAGRGVSMYVCGVTPYDHSHIGHARAYVAFDTLFRVLRLHGLAPRYIRNFTDVDDKIIERANQRGEDPMELARRFSVSFKEDMRRLQCLEPTHEPRVTESVPLIVAMIERIIANGHGYAVEGGDVFFDVRSWQQYGEVSGRGLPEANSQDDHDDGEQESEDGGDDVGEASSSSSSFVSRVAVDERKRDNADFALWKSAKPGEPSWESPWGPGRPGWHIECSAMWESLAGPVLDIHGGGRDLMFPHHENEMAQSGAATCGCAKVRFWMHNGFVTVDSEKMSKSLGNFFTVREVLEQYHPLALRLMLLSTQYRQPLNYTQRALEEASERLYYTLTTIRDAMVVVGAPTSQLPIKESISASAAVDVGRKLVADSITCMSDDLNTPAVLNAQMECLKTMNDLLSTKKGRKDPMRREKLSALSSGLWSSLVLIGLGGADIDIDDTIESLRRIALTRIQFSEEELRRKIDARAQARRDKDFAASDSIRDELAAIGIKLMDGPSGTDWKPDARLDVASEAREPQHSATVS